MKHTELADKASAGEIISGMTATMTYFPLCCSTGVLKNLTATPSKPPYKPCIKMTESAINAHKSIHTLIRDLQKDGNTYIAPVEWAAWFALSLIHQKVTTGKDDMQHDGYSNYKAAQVTWFDRLNEDKRNGKRFNGYNTTFACDSLSEWLDKQDKRKFGQVLVSKAVDGAHGARVRGCIYTPHINSLGKFLEEKLAEVKAELIRQSKVKGGLTWQIK